MHMSNLGLNFQQMFGPHINVDIKVDPLFRS